MLLYKHSDAYDISSEPETLRTVTVKTKLPPTFFSLSLPNVAFKHTDKTQDIRRKRTSI